MILNPETQVVIVDPAIGGGHLTVGLNCETALNERGVDTDWVTPSELPGLSQYAWHRLSKAHSDGGRGGFTTDLYEAARSFLRTPLTVRVGKAVLNHDLGRVLGDYTGDVISTHALSAIRPSSGRLVLLQCDVNGGRDYANKDADLIAVPLPISVDEMVHQGIDPDKVAQVGFFVPKEVKDPAVVDRRINQMQFDPIHMGIFFSGALPEPHVRLVRDRLLPELATHVKKGEMQVTIYTFTSEGLSEEFLKEGMNLGLKVVRRDDDEPFGDWDLRVIYGDNVRDAVERSLKAVGNKDNPISLMATMSNERVGWVKGMAMAALEPINQKTSGGNTNWWAKNSLCVQPMETPYLTYNLSAKREYFAERIQRGFATVPADGAENLASLLSSRESVKS
jgi:hypothetical protein